MGLIDRIAKASDKFYDRMRSGDADSVADAAPTGSIDDLKGRKYCVLVSYRKNGQPMPSPLWLLSGSYRSTAFAGTLKPNPLPT